MNIGFDLDKIFIDYPPFIPDSLIDKLYKKKSNGVLLYRIPGKLEQKIRILSHHPYFRPLLAKNLEFVKKLSNNKSHTLFLISSRFGFLKERTQRLIEKYHLDTIFSRMYFNFHNNQPHLFKSLILKKQKIDLFIDDDLPLLKYLAKVYPKMKFVWLNSHTKGKISSTIEAITDLHQIKL